jgi:transcriptional regulator with XRE-family HTH domain
MSWQHRRLEIGMSQAELADRAGISRTALSLVENGHLRPSARTVASLDRAMDPFSDPVRFVCGGGPLAAAREIQSVSAEARLAYALTLDVAAWLLTRYQTPGSAWAYVRPFAEWVARLRKRGMREAGRRQRADLVLLRAPDQAFRDTRVVDGFVLAAPRRILADTARLGGRRGLDAARLYVEFPEARTPGLRLDPGALLKVFEEVIAWR